jgi:hypothetical protein
MMAKQPEDRYQTARELFRDLTRLRETLSGNSGITVTQPSEAANAASRLSRTVNIQGRLQLRLSGLLVGLVATALVGGLALGWRQSNTDPPSDPPLPDTKGEFPSYQRMREKSLQAAVRELTSPRSTNQRNSGLSHCVELAQLYFDQWRLEDADALFMTLMDPEKARIFNNFGRLGHAMVLAFQDQAEESTEQFQELLSGPDRSADWVLRFINRRPAFVQLVIKALDHNAINLKAEGKTLPDQLQALRQPRPLPVKPRAQPAQRRNQTT